METKEGSIATIWRHLAHWPGLLALAYTGLSSLIQNGKLQHTMVQINEIAQTQGARIAHLRPETASIPEDARNCINRYWIWISLNWVNRARLPIIQKP